jgi:NAD(P)-dependent dehydrogenase (short-subunit alcohol dehydrogenase family)
MLVADRVAVLAGAASGIGRATAKRYADHGASVVVDVDEDGGEETVASITESGGEATFVSTDVSQTADVQRMIETAVEGYGGIDALCNNAGIEGPLAWFEDYDDEAFEQVVATNLRGVFLGTKYGVQAMLADGGGSIVNTSSIVSQSGIRGRSGYAGTKAGINGLTRTAAVEYADRGIRVNSVLPGIVETPMNRRSAATESDVRDGSDLASRVTGIELIVDGGFLQQP